MKKRRARAWFCHGCGRYWTGWDQVHCTDCHAHFSTMLTYSGHRADGAGCVDPGVIVNDQDLPAFHLRITRYGPMWCRRDPRDYLYKSWKEMLDARKAKNEDDGAGFAGDDPVDG